MRSFPNMGLHNPANSSATLFEGRVLTCRRGELSLFEDLSFGLGAGQALLVVVPNGGGKTSLLRIAAGLALPFAGALFWEGQKVRAPAPNFRSHLLYVGHTLAQKDELSVLENLRDALALDAVDVPISECLKILDAVGLNERRHLPTRYLSLGQKRRLSLARMLLAGRRLWLLDEPASGLDAEGIGLLEATLSTHLGGGGMALLTSHQPLQLVGAVATLQL